MRLMFQNSQLQVPTIGIRKPTDQKNQNSPMRDKWIKHNPDQEQKNIVMQKKDSSQNVSNLLDEFKKMGIQTVECADNNIKSNTPPKLKISPQQQGLLPSVVEGQSINIMDFSHYANILKQPSRKSSTKHNYLDKSKINELKELSKKLTDIKQISVEIGKYFQGQKIYFKDQIMKVKNKLLIIEQVSHKEIKKQKLYSQNLQKSYQKLRQQNKLLKKQVDKKGGGQSKVFSMTQSNIDIQKFLNLKKQNSQLQEEVKEIKRLNKNLNNKLQVYQTQKKHKPNQQFTSIKQKQMKQSYLKCIQKFSQEISCLQNQLFKIKQQAKSISSDNYKQKQIYQMHRQLQQKQKNLWNLQQQLNQRQQDIQKKQRNLLFQRERQRQKQRYIQRQRQRVKYRHSKNKTEEDKVFPIFFDQNKKQRYAKSPQQIKSHYSPLTNINTPRSYRSQYFATQIQPKQPKQQHMPKNFFHNKAHKEVVSDKIGQIQSNVRRQLDEMFRRKNHNYEFY